MTVAALVAAFGLAASPAMAQERKKDKKRPESKERDARKRPQENDEKKRPESKEREKKDSCGHDEKGLFEKLRGRLGDKGGSDKELREKIREHMKHHADGRCHCACEERKDGERKGGDRDADRKRPEPRDRKEGESRDKGGMKGG